MRKNTEVKIGLQKLGDTVLSRQAVRRALRQLEAAGLIEVKRTPGSLLAITILEVSDVTPGTAGS
jgi:hypothetical protein